MCLLRNKNSRVEILKEDTVFYKVCLFVDGKIYSYFQEYEHKPFGVLDQAAKFQSTPAAEKVKYFKTLLMLGGEIIHGYSNCIFKKDPSENYMGRVIKYFEGTRDFDPSLDYWMDEGTIVCEFTAPKGSVLVESKGGHKYDYEIGVDRAILTGLMVPTCVKSDHGYIKWVETVIKKLKLEYV